MPHSGEPRHGYLRPLIRQHHPVTERSLYQFHGAELRCFLHHGFSTIIPEPASIVMALWAVPLWAVLGMLGYRPLRHRYKSSKA